MNFDTRDWLQWALRKQDVDMSNDKGQSHMAAFKIGPSGLSPPSVYIHADIESETGCSLWLSSSASPANIHDVLFTEQADHSHPDLSQMRFHISHEGSDAEADQEGPNAVGCSHCLKSLTRPAYSPNLPIITGHCKHDLSSLPMTDRHWPQCSPVTCTKGCGEIYCSEACRSTSWAQYHQLLCPSDAKERGALGRLERFCSSCLPLRIRGELRMAPLLLARAMASEIINQRSIIGNGRRLGLLEGYASMPGGGKQLRFTFQTQALHDLACKAIGIQSHTNAAPDSDTNEASNSRLSLEDYEEGLGRVLVNSIVLKPKSTFSQYFSSLRNTFMASDERETLLDQVVSVASAQGAVDKREAPSFFESKTATSGIGLFRLMSKCNHECCNPSSEAQSFNFLDHTIDLVARRRVRGGEELTISYLNLKRDDASDPSARERRQRQLKESYGFECSCRACTKEEATKQIE